MRAYMRERDESSRSMMREGERTGGRSTAPTVKFKLRRVGCPDTFSLCHHAFDTITEQLPKS